MVVFGNMFNFVLRSISVIAMSMIINILRHLFAGKNKSIKKRKSSNKNERFSIEIDKCRIEDGDYREVKD